MRSFGKAKTIRTAAGIIALIMLVAVLFSAFFVAAEAGRHCCGTFHRCGIPRNTYLKKSKTG